MCVCKRCGDTYNIDNISKKYIEREKMLRKKLKKLFLKNMVLILYQNHKI